MPYPGYFSQPMPAYAPHGHLAAPTRGPTLPPLVAMEHDDPERLNPSVPLGNPPSHNFSTRSLEDQRAVAAFRIRL